MVLLIFVRDFSHLNNRPSDSVFGFIKPKVNGQTQTKIAWTVSFFKWLNIAVMITHLGSL